MAEIANLDYKAAKNAQQIIATTIDEGNKPSDVENLATKTLGVLQENGVYACLLYLYSRTNTTESPISRVIRRKLLALTSWDNTQEDKVETALRFLNENICNDLETLLLTKKLWEQTLIYTRYEAKARGAQ